VPDAERDVDGGAIVAVSQRADRSIGGVEKLEAAQRRHELLGVI
jgi:hypothetical protein